MRRLALATIILAAWVVLTVAGPANPNRNPGPKQQPRRQSTDQDHPRNAGGRPPANPPGHRNGGWPAGMQAIRQMGPPPRATGRRTGSQTEPPRAQGGWPMRNSREWSEQESSELSEDLSVPQQRMRVIVNLRFRSSDHLYDYRTAMMWTASFTEAQALEEALRRRDDERQDNISFLLKRSKVARQVNGSVVAKRPNDTRLIHPADDELKMEFDYAGPQLYTVIVVLEHGNKLRRRVLDRPYPIAFAEVLQAAVRSSNVGLPTDEDVWPANPHFWHCYVTANDGIRPPYQLRYDYATTGELALPKVSDGSVYNYSCRLVNKTGQRFMSKM